MRAFALILLALLGGQADAAEFGVGLGQCRFRLATDGTFYQSDRPTNNYITPRCASLSWADRLGSGPFGWRVGFLWSDEIQARDNVTTFFDDDAFQQNLTCNNAGPGPNHGRGCIVRIRGEGHTRGVSLSGTYEYRLRRTRLIGEAGVFFFRHYWRYRVEHIDCTTCPPMPENYASSGPFGVPTPLVGLTLRAGPAYLAARKYWPGQHRPLSLTDHALTELSAGLSLAF
jgi:hypothetical protein